MSNTSKINSNLATLLALVALFCSAQTISAQTGDDETIVFGQLVEEPPCWTGCDTLPMSERDQCTQVQIIKYLSKNLEIGEMPTDEIEHRTIFVEYAIDENGKVTDVKILRGMHPDIDDKVVKVVESMPDFIPAEQLGKPIKVTYRLPVRIHWR